MAVEQLFDNAGIAAGTLDDPRILLTRLNKVLEMFVYQGAGFDYSKNEYVNAGGAAESPPESQGEAAKATTSETPKPIDDKASKPTDDKTTGGAKFEEKPASDAKPAGNSKFEEVKSS